MALTPITWDDTGKRFYETGVDHGVLYVYNSGTSKYENGVAWNGLTAVTESPSGAEPTALWADNIKYANLVSAEELEARRANFKPVQRDIGGWLARYQKLVSNASKGGILQS